MKKATVFLCLGVFLLSVLTMVREVRAAVTFAAPELLGRPTDHSVTVNVVANQTIEAYFEYGTTSGAYTGRTTPTMFASGTPIEVVIDHLLADTPYYYRMVYREVGTTNWIYRNEHSFLTQRAPGSTFTFTIISDSHMNGGGGNVALYQQTLNNVLADDPDFHLDLGDTFWMDGVTSSTTANQRYLQQRQYMGTISHSVPIFVATGNHENEEGWNFDDANSKALLSVNARKLYYPNPITDGFYSGNDDLLTLIGGDQLREDYYAWKWGDALFIVIDPFQYTMTKPYAGSPGGEVNDETVIGDRWDWTLGWKQYQWFKQTLENSDATFKFIFAHQMVGGSQDYVRGGAMPAHMFEWGGYNADGATWGFDTERPGWDAPIRQIMIDNNVTAFFHGHDHQYAYEKRDGIVYQALPSAGLSGSGFNIYTSSDPYLIKALPSPGHIRVTVSPSQVTVDYVGTSSGTVNYSYTILATPTSNNPPVANNQSVTTNENSAKAITLKANDADGDTLTYSIVTQPSHGTLSGTLPNVTYTPVANYSGSDSFTFQANDGIANSNIATVSITVSSQPSDSNLALNKPATTDSEQTSTGNTASKGNDGNSSTRWSANDGRSNHWWKVDLGATYTLTGTKVQFQFARNYRYRIEVSRDNTNWTIVANRTATTSTAQTRQDSFSATPGRYVRITYTGLPWWYPTTWASHYEFQVYGN